EENWCELPKARSSPTTSVVLRAEVLRVRCLLAARSLEALPALEELFRRFPSLPEAPLLRFHAARFLEETGRREEASEAYRQLMLEYPLAPQALMAHERLVQSGVHVNWSPRERFERALRMLRGGAVEAAWVEIQPLLGSQMPGPLAYEVFRLAARLEGRRGNVEEATKWAERAAELKGSPKKEAPGKQIWLLGARVRAELKAAGVAWLVDQVPLPKSAGRALQRVPKGTLLQAFEWLIAEGFVERAELVAKAIAQRPKLKCDERLGIAWIGASILSPQFVASLLAPCIDDSALGLPARYHWARALEGAGFFEKAISAYQAIFKADPTGYYGIWAHSRLCALETLEGALCIGDEASEIIAFSIPKANVDIDLLSKQLHALALKWGTRLPWIGRVFELLQLGDWAGAREEWRELYAAYHESIRRQPLRMGMWGLFAPSSGFRPAALRLMREKGLILSAEDRELFAQVSLALGEEALAVRWGGWMKGWPRPHAEWVEASALRHKLSPELLFALMRVESVYQPDIVSYAGAVGLMQLMPETARAIAQRLGMGEVAPEMLFDAAFNVELAAWYLRSLLDRFGGCLPVAIAAYNAGPHNVRAWIARDQVPGPLDVWLERIPFDQTRRYVRRVLSAYATYLTQASKPLPRLSTECGVFGGEVVASGEKF
ncbi:MAG: lytic transglycosylase domain-containing protein, partial [Sandaracinaceae bacterium]|nr:lytic transglycosylase domain-containing protein [Sandaracinaceae bacterium]